MPAYSASQWPKLVIFESPLVVAQHIKATRGDHGLNRIGDAIVIRLRTARDMASGDMA
jgi:hypothetical protein